jgi:hypothetical protein
MSSAPAGDSWTVKAVTTAVGWVYARVPPSKVRCALCFIDCASVFEGVSSNDNIGVIRAHRDTGAVVHEACFQKLQQSGSTGGSTVDLCKAGEMSPPLNLFDVK